MTVVVLAGGTGGAKLARGMLDAAGDELVVIANTADDIEIHGAYVSPDPDLVSFWLSDRIDERGWGIAGDTFEVMEEMRRLGEDVWFELGDRDLALGLARARRLAAGESLTTITRDLLGDCVLPMCDEPVRTWVNGTPFQEWMIRSGGKHGRVVDRIEMQGIEAARVTPEIAQALVTAEAIVIGPSNPIISIAPILAVPGMRDAVIAAPAPVVAVSPLVGGRSVKGPSEEFLDWAGISLTPDGIAGHYRGVIDGFVADEAADSLPTLVTDTLMPDAENRARLAREVLEFARSLGAPGQSGAAS